MRYVLTTIIAYVLTQAVVGVSAFLIVVVLAGLLPAGSGKQTHE
jgi:hypothetical protein